MENMTPRESGTKTMKDNLRPIAIRSGSHDVLHR